MSKPQPKKIHASATDDGPTVQHGSASDAGTASQPQIASADQSETGPQPASSVEVVVPTGEIIPELEQEIESAAEEVASIALLPPAPTYTTAFYQNNGIPVCSNCGEKYRTDRHGISLCPVDAVDCPRQP